MSLRRPRLRLLRGGRYREVTLGFTRVLVNERPVAHPDGVLFEENTQLTLSESDVRGKLASGGSVVIVGREPVEFLMVVNEAESAGAFRPGWLEAAWHHALKEADRLQLGSLVTPLVGCIGGASLDEALASFASAVSGGRYSTLRVIDLVCGDLAPIVYGKLNVYAHPLRD